jgi:Ca2+/H+ antiporter, TMEM165/GDT1 family
LIVLALGGTPGRLAPALLGAAVALVLVAGIGLVLHEPLRRLPETQLKLGVGVALTSFGTFFTAEGLRVEWPLGDLALIYLAMLIACVALLATRRLSAKRPRVLKAA